MQTDEIVNENSTHRVIINSVGYDGNPEAPTTFTWDLHDDEGVPISVGNSESPASTVTITIADEYNQILYGRPYERRVLTVTTTFGLGEQLIGQHAYLIKNLRYVSTE